MSEPKKKGATPPRQIPMELPGTLEPAYSNLALIAHSPAEIVIDLVVLSPHQPFIAVGDDFGALDNIGGIQLNDRRPSRL